MDLTTPATLIGRVALGTFLGYVIGFEREFRGKAAGERTFGLLALGAAAVTGLGVLFFPASAEKVIAGVVTGVGFLGAGLIFRERDTTGRGQVLGLTTAASSWAAAAVGIPRGFGPVPVGRRVMRHRPRGPRDQPPADLPEDRPGQGAPRQGDRWLRSAVRDHGVPDHAGRGTIVGGRLISRRARPRVRTRHRASVR
jgi:hypothetical protein